MASLVGDQSFADGSMYRVVTLVLKKQNNVLSRRDRNANVGCESNYIRSCALCFWMVQKTWSVAY